MKFYVITNGYMGNGYVRVYVAAESDDRAKELASEVFKKESDRRKTPYPPRYYEVPYLQIVHQLDGAAEGTIPETDD